jgi:hypothetical protein
MIATKLLSKELLLKDEEFINTAIEEENQRFMANLYNILFEELMDQLALSLDDSYKRANKLHWGCDRHEIRLQQIHTRLNQK